MEGPGCVKSTDSDWTVCRTRHRLRRTEFAEWTQISRPHFSLTATTIHRSYCTGQGSSYWSRGYEHLSLGDRSANRRPHCQTPSSSSPVYSSRSRHVANQWDTHHRTRDAFDISRHRTAGIVKIVNYPSRREWSRIVSPTRQQIADEGNGTRRTIALGLRGNCRGQTNCRSGAKCRSTTRRTDTTAASTPRRSITTRDLTPRRHLQPSSFSSPHSHPCRSSIPSDRRFAPTDTLTGSLTVKIRIQDRLGKRRVRR